MYKYSFYYEVVWYCDSDEPEKRDKGFLFADSYAEAAAILDKQYDVIEMNIKMIGDGPCLRIPDTNKDFDVAEWEEANGF